MEIFILTLFLCPANLTDCTHDQLVPEKTKQFEQFDACENLGKALVDLGEYDDHACRRHEQ